MSAARNLSLNRLNRSSLIDLALQWLRQGSECQPYLANNRTLNETEEEDYLFTPAEKVEDLEDLYNKLKDEEEEMSKALIVDRIVDGDWRRGLSLNQLAMVDFAYLEQNDTALRWTALKLTPLQDDETGFQTREQPAKKRRKLNAEQTYPQLSPTAFVAALKTEISPLVKAHYHLHRLPPPYNLSILRIYISPGTAFGPRKSSIPRNHRKALDAGRVLYIALPGSCPYVYISLSGSSNAVRCSNGPKDTQARTKTKIDMANIKRIILEAIPKAMSRPQERWALESTKLTTRSLKSICELRGNEKPGSAGGAYSKFIEEEQKDAKHSPVDVEALGTPPDEVQSRQREVEARFGSMTGSHHAPIDRFNVKIKDVMRESGESRSIVESAAINISFTGADVFLGLKTLANAWPDGVDLTRLPAWMTGENGVSNLVV